MLDSITYDASATNINSTCAQRTHGLAGAQAALCPLPYPHTAQKKNVLKFNNNNDLYICFAIISGSGMCGASQLPLDRLVLSITTIVGQRELLDIRTRKKKLCTKDLQYAPHCGVLIVLT